MSKGYETVHYDNILGTDYAGEIKSVNYVPKRMHRERCLFLLYVLPIFVDSIIAENVTTFIFNILQLMTNYLRSDHAESDSVSAISQIEKYSFLAGPIADER